MMKLDTVLNTAVRVSGPLETLYALLPLFLLLHMKVEFLFINRYDRYRIPGTNDDLWESLLRGKVSHR